MSISIPVTQARAELPRILEMIEDGDEVTLTRHGQPVAVIVRPDTLRTRRTADVDAVSDNVSEMLRAGSSQPLHDSPMLSPKDGKRLLQEVASSRSGRTGR